MGLRRSSTWPAPAMDRGFRPRLAQPSTCQPLHKEKRSHSALKLAEQSADLQHSRAPFSRALRAVATGARLGARRAAPRARPGGSSSWSRMIALSSIVSASRGGLCAVAEPPLPGAPIPLSLRFRTGSPAGTDRTSGIRCSDAGCGRGLAEPQRAPSPRARRDRSRARTRTSLRPLRLTTPPPSPPPRPAPRRRAATSSATSKCSASAAMHLSLLCERRSLGAAARANPLPNEK